MLLHSDSEWRTGLHLNVVVVVIATRVFIFAPSFARHVNIFTFISWKRWLQESNFRMVSRRT